MYDKHTTSELLPPLFFFSNWHLNSCDNHCKQLIWTFAKIHIHLHLVTSLPKSSSHNRLHPHFLPQKQGRLPASCTNLRKTKETAYLGFTQRRTALWSFNKVMVSSLKGMQEAMPVGGKGRASGPLDRRMQGLPRHVTARDVSSFSGFSRNWKCLGTCANKASLSFNYRIVVLLHLMA